MFDIELTTHSAVLSSGIRISAPPSARQQVDTDEKVSSPKIRERGLRCTIILNAGSDASRIESRLRAWVPVVVEFEHEVLLVNNGHLNLNLTPLQSCIDNLVVFTPPANATAEQISRLAAERASGKYLVFASDDTVLDRLTIRKLAGRLEVTGLAVTTTEEGIVIAGRNVLLEHEGLSQLIERSTADPESTRRRQYHHSMFANLARHIDLNGKRVLVPGCSYGFECELFRLTGASRVVGVDTYPWVGVYYGHHAIEYVHASAEELPFDNASFDICFSIATFEHIPDPRAAAEEIIRVTAPGGLVYIHAAPLWNSPHGHHKDNILPDPWIHLRLPDVERMKAFYRSILHEPAEGATVSDVIEWLHTDNDCNRKSLQDYRSILRWMLESCEPICVDFTRLNRSLLTPQLQAELSGYSEDELLTESLLWILRRI